jgi:hypothetical protein
MPWALRFPDGAEATIDDDSGEWVSADKVVEERLRAETEFWFRVACPADYDPDSVGSMVGYVAEHLNAEIIERVEPGELDPNVAY